MTEIDERARRLREQREAKGWSAAELARRVVSAARARGDDISLTQQAVSFFEMGRAKTTPRWVATAERVLDGSDQSPDRSSILKDATPEQLEQITALLHGGLGAVLEHSDQFDLVPINRIDLSYGLGATFSDMPVEVEVDYFPRGWIKTITHSSPADLAFTRGSGDSMLPTVQDGDLILFDRSRRDVREQDALWAFTIGNVAMIKRLRVRGERVTILSDSEVVPDDTAHADEINIVGRVIFIGRRV